MKEVRYNPEKPRMHDFMESLGDINHKYRNDPKTQKAYENFKRPVWYLKDKSKSNEKTE